MLVKVTRVLSVDLTVYRSHPPYMEIKAVGEVPTLGFTDPQLIPWIYVQPPPDGIYDFDLIAKAPSGFVAQVISKIEACAFLPVPAGLKGVRVHAATNSMEDHWGADREAVAVADGEIPWPLNGAA